MTAWMLAGLALSIPFTGKPTHLACAFPDSGAPAIHVLIAGSHRAVTLTVPSTGHVETQRASLRGGTISFDSPLQYGSVNYAINRADLSIVRTEGGPAVAPIIAKGLCKIEPEATLSF